PPSNAEPGSMAASTPFVVGSRICTGFTVEDGATASSSNPSALRSAAVTESPKDTEPPYGCRTERSEPAGVKRRTTPPALEADAAISGPTPLTFATATSTPWNQEPANAWNDAVR